MALLDSNRARWVGLKVTVFRAEKAMGPSSVTA